jgi:hypothetical protein
MRERKVNSFYLIMLVATQGVAQSPTLLWVDFKPPAYSGPTRMAYRDAHVTIDVGIGGDGTVEIQKSQGPEGLVEAAVDSLKTSKIVCVNCNGKIGIFSIVYDFRVIIHPGSDPCSEANPNAIAATIAADNHVRVTGKPPCIIADWIPIPKVRSIRCVYLWRCVPGRNQMK